MLRITADKGEDGFAWKLEGAPPKCAVEVRFQNMRNGHSVIAVVDANADGHADISYNDFGQHIAINVRVLNVAQKNIVQTLVYDDETTSIHLSYSPEEIDDNGTTPLSLATM